LAAIELARESGVRMISLPPHTTHKLQPLDVAFFSPMGTYYDEAMRKWIRSHGGRCVTTWQVSELFGEAYGRAAGVSVAVNGFKATGLWPLGVNVFSEADFAAAGFTDLPPSNDAPSTAADPEASSSVMTSSSNQATGNTSSEVASVNETLQTVEPEPEADRQSSSVTSSAAAVSEASSSVMTSSSNQATGNTSSEATSVNETLQTAEPEPKADRQSSSVTSTFL